MDHVIEYSQLKTRNTEKYHIKISNLSYPSDAITYISLPISPCEHFSSFGNSYDILIGGIRISADKHSPITTEG